MECRLKENLSRCNCTYEPCPRKGVCCECVAYHRKYNQMPACYFSPEAERSWDRSIGKFIEDYEKSKKQ